MKANVLITFSAAVLYSSPSWAYLDPGTGSMIIQMVIAAIIGGAVFFKAQFSRALAFVQGKKKEQPEAETQLQESNSEQNS